MNVQVLGSCSFQRTPVCQALGPIRTCRAWTQSVICRPGLLHRYSPEALMSPSVAPAVVSRTWWGQGRCQSRGHPEQLVSWGTEVPDTRMLLPACPQHGLHTGLPLSRLAKALRFCSRVYFSSGRHQDPSHCAVSTVSKIKMQINPLTRLRGRKVPHTPHRPWRL